MCPYEELNLDLSLRRAALYPLSYGDLPAMVDQAAVEMNCLISTQNFSECICRRHNKR